jgi:hypothetical protein
VRRGVSSKIGKLSGYLVLVLGLLATAVAASRHVSRHSASSRAGPASRDFSDTLIQSLTTSRRDFLRKEHQLHYRPLDFSQQAIMDEIVKSTLPGDSRHHNNKPFVWSLEYETGTPPKACFTAPICTNGRDHVLCFSAVPDNTARWHPPPLISRRPRVAAGVQR